MTILNPNARKELEDELERRDGVLVLHQSADPIQIRRLQEAEEMELEGLIHKVDDPKSPGSITYRRFRSPRSKPDIHDDSDR